MSRQFPSLTRFAAPRFWPMWLQLGLARVACLLPYRLQMTVGRLLGRVAMPLLRRRRHIAERNLSLCLPELDDARRLRLLRAHFRALGMAVMETALCWWAPDERLRPLLHVEGFEHLERALAAGRGAIMLSAHFTTLEMGARLLSMLTPLHVVYRRHENPLLEEIMRRNRERRAEQAIGKDDIRRMVRSLRDNRPVWYAPDQARAGKLSHLVPFFGQPALTNTATSRLARISGAPVLPFFPERLGDGSGYRIVIGPPLEDFPSDDPVRDAERFNTLIEARVRAVPEQYLWIHRRFKHRGEGHADVYAH